MSGSRSCRAARRRRARVDHGPVLCDSNVLYEGRGSRSPSCVTAVSDGPRRRDTTPHTPRDPSVFLWR
ncbi:hypothetical protein EYF80_039838 [Liparis tanakae]|uniref:Uncharacterized protein n=1 Tax=Liparis tanakae TaxID=230148 RepID=A0A4Z2G9S5_9TELE|nr:hypothetical protein EYF80_039838 [Liparis tanakae]